MGWNVDGVDWVAFEERCVASGRGGRGSVLSPRLGNGMLVPGWMGSGRRMDTWGGGRGYGRVKGGCGWVWGEIEGGLGVFWVLMCGFLSMLVGVNLAGSDLLETTDEELFLRLGTLFGGETFRGGRLR